MNKVMGGLMLVVAVVALGLQNSFAEEVAKAENKICPISGEGFSHGDPVTVEYKGKAYNLCCAMCKKDFLKDPEAAIKKLEAENK